MTAGFFSRLDWKTYLIVIENENSEINNKNPSLKTRQSIDSKKKFAISWILPFLQMFFRYRSVRINYNSHHLKERGRDELEIRGMVSIIHTTALLRSARRLRRNLKNWGDLLTLRRQLKIIC